MTDLNIYRIYDTKAEFESQYDMKTRRLSDGNEVSIEDTAKIDYPLYLKYIDYNISGFCGYWALCNKDEVLTYLQNKINFWETLYKTIIDKQPLM